MAVTKITEKKFKFHFFGISADDGANLKDILNKTIKKQIQKRIIDVFGDGVGLSELNTHDKYPHVLYGYLTRFRDDVFPPVGSQTTGAIRDIVVDDDESPVEYGFFLYDTKLNFIIISSAYAMSVPVKHFVKYLKEMSGMKPYPKIWLDYILGEDNWAILNSMKRIKKIETRVFPQYVLNKKASTTRMIADIERNANRVGAEQVTSIYHSERGHSLKNVMSFVKTLLRKESNIEKLTVSGEFDDADKVIDFLTDRHVSEEVIKLRNKRVEINRVYNILLSVYDENIAYVKKYMEG